MTQQYFSESEWATLVQSPVQTIVGMLLADKTDPVSFLKEVQASMQILSSEVQRQDITNDLVKSLLTSLQEKVTTGETLQGDDLLLKKEFELLGYIRTLTSADEGRKKAIAHMQQVGSILTTKVTAVQASEFKAWLVSLARKVAEAVKEGGFLGIGGERVSKEEDSMLRQIEKALELKV